jgi:hypothetical protein
LHTQKTLHASAAILARTSPPHRKKLSMHQPLFLQEHVTHMISPCSSCYACKNIAHRKALHASELL